MQTTSRTIDERLSKIVGQPDHPSRLNRLNHLDQPSRLNHLNHLDRPVHPDRTARTRRSF